MSTPLEGFDVARLHKIGETDHEQLGKQYLAIDDLSRRIAADLSNDAECFEREQLDAVSIIWRLHGYARELVNTCTTKYASAALLRYEARPENEK